MDVFHPVEIDLLVVRRRKADGLLAAGVSLHRGDGLLSHRLAAAVWLPVDGHEPLRGETRLDHRLAAVAVAHVVDVILDASQGAPRFQVLDDLFASGKAVEARVDAAVFVDVAAVVHDVDRGQMVPLADGEVVGIVRGSHLHRTSAEFAANPRVDDDGDLAIHQRQAQLFAVQMQVALVLGMNGNGGIAEHGFRARGGDGDELAGRVAAVAEHGIANLPQVALLLLVDDFKIADGGLAARAPVNDVRAAIDKALLVEADEGFPDGDRQVLAHREVFALPIDRVADPLHLFEDGAAVVLLPLPHAREKSFAAHLLAGCAFAHHLAFDEHLRGDAGVVGARNPEHTISAHSPPANQDVALSVLKHVAHVQVSRHVGRRQKDRKSGLTVLALVLDRCSAGTRRRNGEQLLFDPVVGPMIFNSGRVVGFRQVVRHFVFGEPREIWGKLP